MPKDSTKPVILVGPGTGIAPFRGFWQHRLAQLMTKRQLGKMWLFFGCRQKELDLYRSEKADMLNKKVLDRVFLALSREPDLKKVRELSKLFKNPATIELFFLDLRARFSFGRSSGNI